MNTRVAILGAGQAGERHAIGFAHVSSVDLVAVCDAELAKAEKLTRRYGGRAYQDWRSVIDLRPDALVVALPHNLHVEPVLMAAGRGIHILLEKPIANTMEEAQRILDACHFHGVKLMLGFVHRFRDEVLAAYGWLQEGRIGTPRAIFEKFGTQGSASSPEWLRSRESAGGGVLMYGAIHGVDRMRWLVGDEISDVSAMTRSFDDSEEVEQAAAAVLSFSQGALGSLLAASPTYAAGETTWDTEIYGTTGVIRIRTRSHATLTSEDSEDRVDAPQGTSNVQKHYNFVRQAKAFIDLTADRLSSTPSGVDGIRSLEVIRAIYDSAATGQSVHLSGDANRT